MSRTRSASAVAVALALALSACSASGGGKDASSATTATTDAKATTTEAAEETTTTRATTTTEADTGDVFRNAKAGYEISIGPDWEAAETQGQADQVWYVAPATADFRANVNVLIQPRGGKDLADYRTDTQDSLDSSLENAELLRSVLREDDDGTERDLFEFTGSSNGLDLHFFATTVISGDTFVLATFSTTADQWDELSPDVVDHLVTLRPI